MKYGRIMALVISVTCIAVLISSYASWKSRINNVKTDKEIIHYTQTGPVGKEDIVAPKKKEAIQLSRTTVEEALINADEQIQNLVLNRLDAEEKVQLLIVGSNAMESGAPGYATLLANALKDTYDNFIETTIAPFDGTSKQFIDKNMAEIDWEKEYDLILLEPFTLNNNGIVKIEDEQKHIKAFKEKAIEEVSDAVIVLQPSYPIYHANFYLVQIRALENFSATNAYPYINHWNAWPDTTDSSLKSLLTEDQSPNSEGAKVWASPLINYFTGK
ncbi:SGNH/GDSL hydrolase family protein [Psychrobacillus sp. NPDC093180]|uniref:SGNH/GDSL hydrolase family protein n=1 Tax=Psychrobacillus sp. NPDC093180 TaxID=3364489 RepID=UPI00382BF415